jgi:hypothetical protein
MFLAINLTRHFFRLLAGGTQNMEFQLAVLSVPNGEPSADGHHHANPADVFGNLIQSHIAEISISQTRISLRALIHRHMCRGEDLQKHKCDNAQKDQGQDDHYAGRRSAFFFGHAAIIAIQQEKWMREEHSPPTAVFD